MRWCCPSACLFVCLSVAKKVSHKNAIFSKKLSNLELWSPSTTYRKSYMDFSKNPYIGPIKFKMADGRHFINRFWHFGITQQPIARFQVRKIWRTMCVSINGPGDPDLWPFDLETGMRVASMVGNLPSKFWHTRPLGCRIIRYVRDGQTDERTDGRTKATLISPYLRARA